ncbi:hypothetical protein FGRMN_6100 [Fusarium graminum]|nr:hypothetical protein FGRMN_6100 [Fusarium graminum]
MTACNHTPAQPTVPVTKAKLDSTRLSQILPISLSKKFHDIKSPEACLEPTPPESPTSEGKPELEDVQSQLELMLGYADQLSEMVQQASQDDIDDQRESLRRLVNYLDQSVLSGRNIHSVLGSSLIPDAQKSKLLRSYYGALHAADIAPPLQKSGLFAIKTEGSPTEIFAVFGGQGLRGNNIDELRDLVNTYPSLIRDLVRQSSLLLLELSRSNNDALRMLPNGLDVLGWLESPSQAPDSTYLASAPVSAPMIGLVQLAHYEVTCKTLGLTPGQFRSRISGTTGHSQGIITAAAVASADDWISWRDATRNAITTLFWIGVRTQQVWNAQHRYNTISEAMIRDSIDHGERKPSPMLSIRGLTEEQLQTCINAARRYLKDGALCLSISMVNGAKHFVVSGSPIFLYGLNLQIRKRKNLATQNRTADAASSNFLDVSVPFHTHWLNDAVPMIRHDLNHIPTSSSTLKIPLFSTENGQDIRHGANELDLVSLVVSKGLDWVSATSRMYPDNSMDSETQTVLDFGPGGVHGISSISSGGASRIILAEIFFSIVPSCVFLALALGRLFWLFKKTSIPTATTFLYTKLSIVVVFAALQLAQLVLATQERSNLVNLSVPAEILRFAVIIAIFLLSFIEYKKSPRPSVLLGCFLSLTLLFDIVRTRTIWLLIRNDASSASTFVGIVVTTTVFKGLVLVFEAQHKIYPQEWKDSHSPEEISGIFSLSTYTWVDRLLLSGFRSLLSIDDLYALDQTMSASTLQVKMNKMGARGSGTSSSKPITRQMLKTLMGPLLLPVLPRVAVIGFTFCQPFLIKAILTYLESPGEAQHSYGLIGATVIVYAGIAISNALYFYWQERFACMLRGLLYTAVYDKTISLHTAVANDSAALTLMNSDIERIKMGLMPIHEYWANTIEVIVASWLLERQLGAAFAAPIVVVVLCIVASGGVASIAGRRQVAWMKTIEVRVAATATTIASMKALRISGMLSAVEKLIQGLREHELKIGGKWRLMLVIAVTLSFTPTTIGPLMAFAVTSRSLEVTRIFPAMAFMTLLAGPLSGLFQNIPGLMSAIACLGRIDAYVDQESRKDARLMLQQDSFPDEKRDTSQGLPVLEVKGGEFGWTAEKPVLKDVDMKVFTSSLTIILGSVASGKSTLLKGLLGETTFCSGTITLGTTCRKIGYCDQTPFLFNDSIRGNIIGHASFDAARYQQVLYSTALEADLRELPKGDRTTIGGNGVSLSGGQKQRLALARALYLDAHLYLLDDIFSGLDASTSALVFQRTIGPNGLLSRRNATVVLCTHDEQWLKFADSGFAITDGAVEELVVEGHLKGVKPTEHPPLLNAEVEEALETVGSDDPSTTSQQDQARQLGDFSVYRHYFSAMANWVILLFVLSCCCYGFTSSFPTVWLKYWSADIVRPSPNQSGAFYVGIYALLQTCCLLSLSGVVLLCTQSMISQSGSILHQRALQTVMGAPLRFFTLVDAGTVTNHFAQDLTLIDSELPLSLINFALSLFSLLGMAAVIATASPWLAISYPFLVGVVYYIQLFYLRTSRQLRLLDLDSKAPLYAHFIDTLSGLITVRALGHVDVFMATSNSLLDTSQRPAYLLAMIQRWLQFVLRVIVMVIATIIVTLATQLRTDSGFTGATLVTLMSFGDMLATIVQSYTTLETSIGAVARLKTFSSSTEQESKPDSELLPDSEWPRNGHIEMTGVSATYSANPTLDKDAMAIQNVNITFKAGEIVAIVGRTGSGKSSLLLLLLRLLDASPSDKPSDGITVDGLYIESIDRDLVRRRIIAVSQDPVFMPACAGSTLRSNLDPFHEATDDDILRTLDLHGLSFLAKVPDGCEESEAGLDGLFSNTSLSQGQQQLFSLARAVIRKRVRSLAGATGGVLLLDEASSSVDSESDKMMWEIIEDEFEGYTIIMVVHRLNLAMRCDRVVVMEKGKVVESGQPGVLRYQEGGAFNTLMEAMKSENPE